MKYKFKIWKYCSLNTGEGETMLNQESAEGWNLKSIGWPLSKVMLFERVRPQDRKKYTVDLFNPAKDGCEGEGRDVVRSFYRQLGWEPFTTGKSDIMIFEAPYKAEVAPAYVNEEERRQETKSKLNKTELAILTPMALLFYGYLFSSVVRNRVDTGNILVFIFYILLLFCMILGDTAGKVTYLKDHPKPAVRISELSIRMETIGGPVLWILESTANVYLIWTGQFGNHANDFLCLCCVIAGPAYLLGEYLLLFQKKYILGTILLGVTLMGVVIGPLVILEQLGWIID